MGEYYSSMFYQRKHCFMEKRAYFAGSIRGGRGDAAVYKRIIDYTNRTDTVLMEHIGSGSLNVKARTKEDDVYTYERDTEWLRSSDVPIAERASPFHGVDCELAYAEAHNIPVHISHDKRKANIPAMLDSNAYFKVHPYENEAKIYSFLDIILGNK